MKPVVGIDAHKQTCTYVVRHWNERIEGPKTIPSTAEALRKLAREHPGHVLVLEACGVQEWMLDVLRAEGTEAVAIVPPKKESKDGKSDGKDADRIARKYLVGDVREVYVPPPELRRVREVVRGHEFLKVERTGFNNHLKMHLNRWNFRTRKAEPDRTAVLRTKLTQGYKGAEGALHLGRLPLGHEQQPSSPIPAHRGRSRRTSPDSGERIRMRILQRCGEGERRERIFIPRT